MCSDIDGLATDILHKNTGIVLEGTGLKVIQPDGNSFWYSPAELYYTIEKRNEHVQRALNIITKQGIGGKVGDNVFDLMFDYVEELLGLL